MLSKSKIILKNIKIMVERQPVYLVTMLFIAALMYAFNSMLFSEDVQRICEQGFVMDVLIGFVTILIVIITAWLVYYMMEYSLKLRSKEFSLYLLFGVKQNELFRLYKKETLINASISCGIGCLLGGFLKQFLMAIFYQMFRLDYIINMDFKMQTLVLTFIIYFICYFLALWKIHKQIKMMNIKSLKEMEKINESEKRQKHRNYHLRKFLLKGNRLFIWRSVEAEIISMKKIISFVSVLLFIAIFGSTVAMMYTDYENKQIDEEFPYDLMVFHENPSIDFEAEKNFLSSYTKINSLYEYVIFRNNDDHLNQWLYTNLNYFGDIFVNEDGNFAAEKLEQEDDYDVYYEYDTYMKVSDYNALLKMLGQDEVDLAPDEYIFQVKRRLEPEIKDMIGNERISLGNQDLHCKEIRTTNFGQNGHNGADYIIVVSDQCADDLEPFYTVMTAMSSKPLTEEISEKLENLSSGDGGFKYGSNHSVLYTSPILAKKEIEITLKSTVTAVLFPFAYVSLVFLCVAMSILATHLISTAGINKHRYDLLNHLGMVRAETDKLIHEQLAIEYFIPLLIAVIPGIIISIKISNQFVTDTGLQVWVSKYIILSLIWVITIYLIYFLITDIFYRRNINHPIIE